MGVDDVSQMTFEEFAKEIIGKNNLTPSEFLRPFGIFSKVDFRLGTFFTSVPNFRLDFYDAENFCRPNQDQCFKAIEAVLSDPKINPELPAYNLKDRKQNYKIPDISAIHCFFVSSMRRRSRSNSSA